MKLRRRVSQVRVALDEPWGEQNLSSATTLSDTRPDHPEEAYRKRQIAKRLAHATSRLPVNAAGNRPPVATRVQNRWLFI
jgi:hypothetical protein